MIFDVCPGADPLRNPRITEKVCPVCGNRIEVFSVDTEVACDRCGYPVLRDALLCTKWCRYAAQCGGIDRYQKLLGKRNGSNAQAQQVFTPPRTDL